MKSQLKTRSIGLAAALIASTLTGCVSSHPSAAWQGSGMEVTTSGNTSALLYSPGVQYQTQNDQFQGSQDQSAQNQSSQGQGNYIALYTDAPEYGRRDHTLSTRDTSRRDELLGIRPETHPSLNNQRTFRTSRDADRYNYPSTEPRGSYGYNGYRGSHHYRSYTNDRRDHHNNRR